MRCPEQVESAAEDGGAQVVAGGGVGAEPTAAVRELAECRRPYLLGVRHHSPALAAAVPALLAQAEPEVLFVELPADFAPWLPYLADPATVPPVALAGHGPRGLVFLPFAEFSPELAALRWAREAGVPVVPFDLPLGVPEPAVPETPEASGPSGPGSPEAGGPETADGPHPGGLDRRSGGPETAEGPGPSGPGGPGGPEAADGLNTGGLDGQSGGAEGAASDGSARRGGGGAHSYPAHRSGPWPAGGLARALRERAGGRPEDDLWDRLVEAAAPGAAPESLRRAALSVGWALRGDAEAAGRLDPHDLRREAYMRRVLAEHPGKRAAVVVGAFHGPALLPDGYEDAGADAEPYGTAAKARPATGRAVPAELAAGAGPAAEAEGAEPVTTCLVPYTYALLDERSGYPAGIRDPEWQRGVVEAAGDPARMDELLLTTAVRICAEVRAAGHPCGPPDAREVVRHARDLATLRGLPAAGRGELLEAVSTALNQGQLLGRGRIVARALETVLVGSRYGRTAPGTPRSGLGPSVEALLDELGLPGPGAPERRELRLDPHRSPLDRRRELALRRLALCRVPYGEIVPGTGIGPGATPSLGTRWTVEWTPATAAMLDAASAHGTELTQAAEGLLRQRALAQRRAGGPSAAEVLAGLEAAAVCGLPGVAAERLDEAARLLPATGTLPELLTAMTLLDRIASGLLPGLPADWQAPAVTAAMAELTAAGVRALDGLTGSEDPADAAALAELAARGTPGLRITGALARLAADGSPLIRGAASAVRVLLGESAPGAFGTVLAARTHDATTPELRLGLARFLAGALTAAGPLLEAGPLLAPVTELVGSLPDRAFLTRLPALRQGFQALSPAARDRLLATVRAQVPAGRPAVPDPAALARHAAADLAGRELLAARGLLAPPAPPAPSEPSGPEPAGPEPAGPTTDGALPARDGAPPDTISPDVRWQLLLGRLDEAGAGSGPAARIASALDELYGSGRGEGAGTVGGSGGGREAPYPDVRSWSEELADLFGADVREEVLAAAAATGRVEAALALDPAAARPSVDLLRTVLSYAGGLPEGQLARLRPLVARLVRELTESLASRMRPALTGLSHPRPTRRPGGRLDLGRTLRANLATAHRDPVTGAVTVRPERPVFRTRARRSADWRIVLVVDVSGSMEASTVWAAITASVLAGVPALSTHFLAFSTEVLDLTDHVDDPLGLLLEVRVGGGTFIAGALQHARTLITVPSRTLVVLVSDFEEGGAIGPLLSEVRALVESGCHVLGCAALDDEGRGRYSAGIAGRLVAAGMPVAALGPLQLARWIGERVSPRS